MKYADGYFSFSYDKKKQLTTHLSLLDWDIWSVVLGQWNKNYHWDMRHVY